MKTSYVGPNKFSKSSKMPWMRVEVLEDMDIVGPISAVPSVILAGARCARAPKDFRDFGCHVAVRGTVVTEIPEGLVLKPVEFKFDKFHSQNEKTQIWSPIFTFRYLDFRADGTIWGTW